MVNIPVRFKRVAAAFDEVARGRLCESSGSEHSAAESFTDLSDLVNSFLERDIHNDCIDQGSEEVDDQEKEGNGFDGESNNCSEYDTKDVLKSLLDIGDDNAKRRIRSEVEKALVEVGNFSSPDFKRRLMARLRDRGLDAGLCKSKWEKIGRCPPGVYEYIDVVLNETRYIVEVSLAAEFEIARSTGCYTSLLANFPQIFVGKAEEIKKIVKIMCNAIRTSMKKGDIHVPPWRRPTYMQAKWSASYKRTINDIPARKAYDIYEASSTKRSVGFAPVLPEISYCYREDFGSIVGARKVGNLAAAFKGSPMLV